MKKTIQKWVDNLGAPKNTKFVDAIVEKADGNFSFKSLINIYLGDLKSAMSLLEFCRVNEKMVNSDFVCTSDTPIDIFHFLGKILYAKRLDVKNKAWNDVEGKLAENVKPEYRRKFSPKDDLSELSRASTLSNSAVSLEKLTTLSVVRWLTS